MSESRRAKYYSIKSGPNRVNKIPKRIERAGYTVDEQGYILDKSGQRVIANTRTVGKPRLIPINNQYIYSQKGSHYTRQALVRGLENYYMPLIIEKIAPIKANDLPVVIEAELYAVPNANLPDGDNFGTIYYKVFSDCLVRAGIIPDDKMYYISKPGSAPLFYPIEKEEERVLIFHFFADRRAANRQLLLNLK
jgi:hypothetical protein